MDSALYKEHSDDVSNPLSSLSQMCFFFRGLVIIAVWELSSYDDHPDIF